MKTMLGRTSVSVVPVVSVVAAPCVSRSKSTVVTTTLKLCMGDKLKMRIIFPSRLLVLIGSHCVY